jgi:hypothetical protein
MVEAGSRLYPIRNKDTMRADQLQALALIPRQPAQRKWEGSEDGFGDIHAAKLGSLCNRQAWLT